MDFLNFTQAANRTLATAAKVMAKKIIISVKNYPLIFQKLYQLTNKNDNHYSS